MTTDEPKYTPNVFANGGEILLPRPPGSQQPLAALSFVERVTTDLRDARRHALLRALPVAEGAPVTEAARLLVGYGWQPDGAKARTSSPLKGLAEKGISFGSEKRCEILIVASAGIRWVAEVVVETNHAAPVEAALFEAHRAVVVVGARESVVHRFLAAGWGESDDERIVVAHAAVIAATLGLLVVRLYGAFDDREASADIIGSPERIQALRASTS